MAGGCARYMFDENIIALKKSLDERFLRVGDPLAFTTVSMASPTYDAVNSLMPQFYSKERGEAICTLVSKYVLLRAHDVCRTRLTDAI